MCLIYVSSLFPSPFSQTRTPPAFTFCLYFLVSCRILFTPRKSSHLAPQELYIFIPLFPSLIILLKAWPWRLKLRGDGVLGGVGKTILGFCIPIYRSLTRQALSFEPRELIATNRFLCGKPSELRELNFGCWHNRWGRLQSHLTFNLVIPDSLAGCRSDNLFKLQAFLMPFVSVVLAWGLFFWCSLHSSRTTQCA